MKVQVFFDICAFAALALFNLIRRNPPKSPIQLFPRWFPVVLKRPGVAFLMVGFLAFGGSALLTGITGIPKPLISDEFSYLLASDTFAHGRLANPAHPMWKHFETFHVIQQPTYASKYPPAQGLSLALGQVLFGHPIAGVWLGTALACAAICWMLAGWCPLSWAWFGGLVAVVQLVFSFPATTDLDLTAPWSQSYWGGCVAALGGALVLGALPRIMKKQRWRDALWLVLGLSILANSRPFEGLVVSIPAALTLAIWLVKTRSIGWRQRCSRVVLPVALGLSIMAGWMGYYNFRVTGDPFRLPYQVYESTYGVVPVFLWQPLKAEPPYHHPGFECLVRLVLDNYLRQQTLAGWLKEALRKIRSLWMYFIGILFTPFFVASLPKMWRRRRVRFALGVWTLMLAALLTETWVFPHYAAPVTSLAILLIVESLRQIRLAKWRDKAVGTAVVRTVLPVLLLSNIIFCASLRTPDWSLERAQLLQVLEKMPGRHLVMVHYGPNHCFYWQWIYNRADIDGAKVVWAWEMGPQADRELFDYFKDRRVWLLQADQKPRHLIPFPGTNYLPGSMRIGTCPQNSRKPAETDAKNESDGASLTYATPGSLRRHALP